MRQYPLIAQQSFHRIRIIRKRTHPRLNYILLFYERGEDGIRSRLVHLFKEALAGIQLRRVRRQEQDDEPGDLPMHLHSMVGRVVPNALAKT